MMWSRKTNVLLAALAVTALLGTGSVPAQETWKLSRDEALRIALENNLSLVSARYDPELSREDIQIQKSNYDPGLRAFYERSERDSPATQSSTITGQESDTLNAGVQQNLKFGANYTVGFQALEVVATGPNVLAPTQDFASLSFTVNVPLLKGLGTEVTTEQLILANNNLEISLSDLEGRAEQTMEAVEGAFYDVVAAQRTLDVARRKLTRARDLLELNRKKVEVGTLAPIEITQAEAGVASDEESVIVAETSLADAEDELRRLLAIPQADPRWTMPIEAKDLPEFRPITVDLEAATRTAMESRSEILSARQRLQNSELSERAAKRRVKHQLDFDGGYTSTGTSLDMLAFDPGTMTLVQVGQASISDAVDAIPDNDAFNWRAQLTYTIPLKNREAKASYARARIGRQQADVNLRDQEQTVRVDVRRAARAVESGVKRVNAASVNVVLQRKKLEAEQKKFENGMSTSFEVLTFQNDLADAELSEIRALLDYVKSLAALERSKGTLLEERGLSLSR